MKIVDCQEDLGGIKLSPRLLEPLPFAEMSEHFSSPDEIHDKEDLFLGLEGILQLDQEGMIGYINKNKPFSSKNLSVLVLLRCSF